MQLRAPAFPLITVDPFFSVWSATDRLTDSETVHWTGFANAINAVATIDGTPYRFMGNDAAVPAMCQVSRDMNAVTTTYVLEAAGGLTDEPGKVIFGGPMMGVAIYSLEYPVMKNCNAIVVLNKKDAKKQYENPCIHCGRCVAICPMGLNPTVYAKALNVTDAEDRIERYTEAKLNLCIECGSCSYVCPSNRPLVENNKIAKTEMREFMLARQEQKK